MLTRRSFSACALCGIAGFAAMSADAQTPGAKRTILTRMDGPAEGYETVIVDVEFDPGFLVPRHTHPGIESAYVVEGGGELSVDGQQIRRFRAGDGMQVPPKVPHSAKIDAKTHLLVNYVVEKGKPMTSPA